MSLDPRFQVELQNRPKGYPVMRQSWRDLLFLHFACAPEEISPFLPPGLSPDTFPDESGKEMAWVGLVPFLMKDVRWAFAPRVPGTHTFPETNVRTYVHRDGRDPGVWFFSLDAMNSLAVRTARAAFALPYFNARMSLQRDDDRVRYAGERGNESYEIAANLGGERFRAIPGSLEFFLVERYLLYAYRRRRLFSGQVHHPPYLLYRAHPETVRETLVQAAMLVTRPFEHHVFSEGVDVEIFRLRPI